MSEITAPAFVKGILAEREPLRTISFAHVMKRAAGLHKQRLSAAYQACVLGYRVSARDIQKGREDQVYYGLRWCTRIHLALPGIPRHRLLDDAPSTSARVKAVQDRLSATYGPRTFDRWIRSAQLRSVDDAAQAMRDVRARDHGKCVLCGLLDPSGEATVRAHHLSSRKAAFYAAVAQVENELPRSLFSDRGAERLEALLTQDPLHSHTSGIALLCNKHDRELRRRLAELIAPNAAAP